MDQTISELLRTTPGGPFLKEDSLADCIRACFECSQACAACADACLGEEDVKQLRRCIRLNLDCAEACSATGDILSRQVDPDLEIVLAQVQLLELICDKCAKECGRHAQMHEHCRICMESCLRCADSCKRLGRSLAV